MAWSSGYTGRSSIIKDSYHRVALWISTTDMMDEMGSMNFIFSCTELAKDYFLHITISIPDQAQEGGVNVDDVLRVLNNVAALERQLTCANHPNGIDYDAKYRKLFLTLQLPHHEIELLQRIVRLEFYFDLLIMHVNGNKEQAFKNIRATQKMVQDTNCKSSFGVGSVEDQDELHWLLSKLDRDSLQFVHLGNLALPNLRLRCVDLAYSYGCNVMIDVTSDELEKTSADDTNI